MRKVKAIWVGTENEPVKVWEEGKVLDDYYFAYLTSVVKEVVQNG